MWLFFILCTAISWWRRRRWRISYTLHTLFWSLLSVFSLKANGVKDAFTVLLWNKIRIGIYVLYAKTKRKISQNITNTKKWNEMIKKSRKKREAMSYAICGIHLWHTLVQYLPFTLSVDFELTYVIRVAHLTMRIRLKYKKKSHTNTHNRSPTTRARSNMFPFCIYLFCFAYT